MKKRGFTLVEMLVVLGILGILVTVLMKVASGGMESARSAKCIANMKTLAAACDAYNTAKMAFPFAGSLLCADYLGNSGTSVAYGWVGSGGAETTMSCYVTDRETREDCIVNGQLYGYVNNNRDVFVCPSHKSLYKSKPPAWSYVMNEMFGWDSTGGAVDQTMLMIPKKKLAGVAMGSYNHLFGKMRMQPPPLERVLLFAEIPFTDSVATPPDASEGSGTERDCTLQYSDKNEYIGFNHKSGGNWVAHVAFCDGHVEKFLWHKNLSRSDAELLTKLLATGAEVSYNGSNYEDLYE